MDPKPTPRAKCEHTRSPVLITRRPLTLTAGSASCPAPLRAARLALAGDPKPTITGLPGFTPVVVKIDWPDMGTPAIDRADWQWLVKRLKGLNRPLHINCAMGHGRTGTCLAIVGHFLGVIPRGADPVAWVREVYCPDAVETRGQITYIETVTGRSVLEVPRPPMGTNPTPSTYGGTGSGARYPDPSKVERMGTPNRDRDIRGF